MSDRSITTGKSRSSRDVTNYQLAGVEGDYIVILAPKTRMTKEDALRHAAWLVALAGDLEEFRAWLTAVEGT